MMVLKVCVRESGNGRIKECWRAKQKGDVGIVAGSSVTVRVMTAKTRVGATNQVLRSIQTAWPAIKVCFYMVVRLRQCTIVVIITIIVYTMVYTMVCTLVVDLSHVSAYEDNSDMVIVRGTEDLGCGPVAENQIW